MRDQVQARLGPGGVAGAGSSAIRIGCSVCGGWIPSASQGPHSSAVEHLPFKLVVPGSIPGGDTLSWVGAPVSKTLHGDVASIRRCTNPSRLRVGWAWAFSSTGRAPLLQSGGWGFESLRAYEHNALAEVAFNTGYLLKPVALAGSGVHNRLSPPAAIARPRWVMPR